MSSFLDPTVLPSTNNQILINPVTQTLRLEITPQKWIEIEFPLRAGTYEHLAQRELEEIAIFIRLKGLRSEDTKRRYTAEIEKFVVWLEHEKHTSINEWVLMDYQQALLNPPDTLRNHPIVTFRAVSPETTDQYLAVVRSFISHLHSKNLLSYNPAVHVPRIGITNKQALEVTKHFNKDQWSIVLETLDTMPDTTPGERNRKERLRFCIRFGYAMGLRIKEQSSHFHYHLNQYNNEWNLRVVGKGMRARKLSLHTDDIAIEALQRYREFLKLSPMPEGESLPLLPALKPVIIKTKGPNKGITIKSQPITKSTWDEQFKFFLQNEVMQHLYPDNTHLQREIFDKEWVHLTPHSLRHTRITHLIERGHDLLWVQKFAGHENLDTTRRYFHSQV